MRRDRAPFAPIRDFLRKAVGINYLVRVASVLIAFLLLFEVTVFIGARWAFEGAPYGSKVLVFHGVFTFVALLLLRYWAWPRIRRPLSMERMAHRLESADPNLHECLTSTLQFSTPDPVLEQCLEPSRQLLSGFYEDATLRIHAKKRWRWIVPVYFWPLSIVMAVSLLLWLFIDHFVPFTARDAWNLYQRNFLSNPYRPMHQLVVKPGFSEALKGDPLTVQANLLGPGFWTASITYNMAMFPEQTAEMKTREGLPNSFEFEFKNLQGDLRYKVQAGPLESVEYLVQVKPPAELTEIQLTYYYPEFMARGHEPQPTGQGAAMAPIGSTVEVTTRWSRPMKEVNIAVNGEAPIPCRQTDPYWRGAFRIESAGSYILSGSSVDGVPLRGNLEFPLQVLVDLPPTVEWIFPKEDIDFSEKKPKGKIPLRFRIEDDVGIQSVFLYSGSPGAVTQTHQIAQLDGKTKALESTFLFDWRPWMNRPVCRLYLEALDNHPQIPGRKRNETRRLYFQPPGSFEEIDSTTPEEEVIEDPYELTAIRLFFLLRKQMSQNSFVAENESKSPDLGDWKKTQRRTMQLAAQTAFSAWNSAQDLKRGPGAPAGVPAEATPAKEASTKVALPERPPDLPIRLEMVAQRLGGVEISIDDLLAAPPATGEAVVHRQARQYDAADKSYLRRSWEEGERAAREIAKAYKDLTGREPPISAERVENTIAEETRKAEGEEAEQQAKAEQAAKDQLRLGGDQESKDGASAAGVPGDSNDKEKDKQEKRQGESAASAPTSKYAPSEYTLDPDTVTLTTPQVQLMQNALSGTLAEDKAREFLQRPVPPEYKEAVAEYNRILLGE